MTDNSNTESVDINDNLDSFETAFFQKETVAPEEPVDEQEEEVEDTPSGEDDAPAADSDEDAPDEGDEDESQEEGEEEDESDPEPKGKRRKPDAEQRIKELTKARREAERQNQELLRRLEALEASTRSKEKETPVQERLPQGAPSPDAVDDNGDLIYALGEFDPKFIRDLTKYTIDQEKQNMLKEEADRKAAEQLAAQQTQLVTQWNEKLEQAEQENPDIREHIADLVDTIQSMRVDPGYGDYLATTVMQCENGPQILEYLSENIGEAQKIVASGPAAATLAIGKLDARFTRSTPNEEEKRNIRIPSARTPPPVQTKGRQGRAHIRGDVDNLDDFEKVFYAKK